MSSTTIYLKLPQVKEVYEPEVYLGMIADVHSSDRAAEAKAKAVKITSFSGKGKEAVFVGNVMELVEKIEKTGQNIQVDNIGESDFVVTYRAGKKKSLVWEWMKTAMVSAVAFFGAAFAIMTFNNDANVTDVIQHLPSASAPRRPARARSGRPAPFYDVGRPDPDGLRRISGILAGKPAPDQGGGCVFRLAH